MKKKIILICAILALTTTSFSQEVEKIENTKKQEISQQEIRDYKKIRDGWVEFLTGLPQDDRILEMSKADISRIVAMNEGVADKVYENMNFDKNRTSIFKGAENMKNGVHVMRQYENLVKIAKAYATPGTKYYKNEKTKQDIIDSLDWLYDNVYHEGLPELGNWWQWELGIPKNLNDLLTLVYDDVPAEKRMKYLKASQYFQPYAEWSGVSPSASYSSSPDKRISTGGNRMDTSIISFLRGVLMEDKVQVLDGLNAVADVGEYVTSGDGFYRDGSFIQHDNVAYNGTYAAVLFNGLGSILWLINGTEFKIEDPRIDNIYESILNGYSYLMINGGVNDSVNGRSISRDKSNDVEKGRALVSSFAMLSEGASPEYKEKLQSLIKKLIQDNNSYYTIDKVSNQTIKNILIDIMNNKSIKPLEVNGTKVFGAMDRAVYFNGKDGKVVVSMHSSRVANFETMNGENIKGWYTGDGMTYIYGKDSSAFTEFWPTVDDYHLPGVTNSLNPRGDKSGERRMKPFLSPRTFVGGAETGKEAFVGMDMISWNKQTEMKKSWFMIDGVILAIASNIDSRDGIIHTTIDNRILEDGKIYLDGKQLKEEITIQNPKNLSINFNENYPDENIGYKIVEAPEVVVKVTENKGSWKDIGGSSDKEITKKYFTTYINHGKNPKDAKYAYVILPMFSKEEVDSFDTSRFEIVKADNEAHIVKDRQTNTVGINFWKDKPQKFEGIKTYSTLSVLKKEKGDILDLYVSDPAQIQNYDSKIELDGKYELVESTDKNIKLNIKNFITEIEVDLKNNGATKYIKLRKVK